MVCVVPFERFAVATNCAGAPITGGEPVTVTDVTATIGGAEGAVGAVPFPSHAIPMAMNATNPSATGTRKTRSGSKLQCARASNAIQHWHFMAVLSSRSEEH